jgi:hypothetical protein
LTQLPLAKANGFKAPNSPGTLVAMLFKFILFDQFGLKPGKDVILVPLAKANGN